MLPMSQGFRVAQKLRLPQRQIISSIIQRKLHEYLVIINDDRGIESLDMRQTFAGKILSDDLLSPRTIFACHAASIREVEEALQEKGPRDLSTVSILPLDTVHTSELDASQTFKEIE